MEEGTDIEPKVEEIEFPGKLLTSLDDIQSKLSNIPFYSFHTEARRLEVIRVESRNVKKKPFLFYMMNFGSDSVRVTYSIIPGESERLRRATVIKSLASALSVMKDSFQIDETKFFQYVDSVMDNLINGLSQSYSTLFNKYDSLLSEYVEVKKLSVELVASNRNLTIETGQLNEENKMLKSQLKSLQTYTDESLMSMIEDWIEVHNSSIDIGEFSKTYKIPEPRIEQVLDKMASLGYLELKS